MLGQFRMRMVILDKARRDSGEESKEEKRRSDEERGEKREEFEEVG